MDIIHVWSLPLHVNPGQVDPCVGRHWVALPLTKTTVGLWKISHDSTKDVPVELTGHSREISALSFSSDRVKYLLSACREKILLWDLLAESGGNIFSKLFCLMPGEATSLTINNNNDIIAAGVDFKIFLFKEGNKSPLAVLEAHRGTVTRLKFCPHYSATLVSLSDDRSFCVWDIRDSLLLFRSTIISPSPLISVSMNWTHPQVAIGTADGILKIFDLTDGNDFRQLSNTNICLALRKKLENKFLDNGTVPAGPIVGNKKGKQLNADFSHVENQVIVELSESILTIEYVYFAQECSYSNPFVNKCSGIGDILTDKPPLICVITSSAILQINSRTFEILSVVNMQNPMTSKSFFYTKTIGLLSYAASCQTGPSQMLAVVGTIFDRKIEVVQLEFVERQCQILSDKSEKSFLCLEEGEDSLSIIPVSTILSSSPLMSEMLPPIASDTVTKGDVATGKKKLHGIMNQPLTFKSKIKSSGYSQPTRTTMFKPETSRNKLLNMGNEIATKQEKMKVSLGKMLKAEYDESKGPPLDCCDTFQVDHQGSAVFALRFSDDGSALGCALSNKCALTLKSPYSKHISTFYVGHNNALNSLHWSSSSGNLVTSSNDKRALLWSRLGGDPILSLTHHNGTMKELYPNKKTYPFLPKGTPSSISCRKLPSSDSNNSKGQSLTSKENKLFTKEIKYAQFFYMDKFILLTHGDELLLYKYHITLDRDEIKRYQPQNRYKLVASWQTASCVFTATAAVNKFYSHLVICTTSGRTMEVYDLNRSVLAYVFPECHSRPAHSVIINEGSRFAFQQSEAYNVIATAAPTDPIKLWDLRTKTNVQALQGHVNKAHACQIALSPCGNYLASGSENQMVYLFDLRKGTYLDCLKGHNEVVTSVAFHPGNPLLASGSLNGKILFFRSK